MVRISAQDESGESFAVPLLWLGDERRAPGEGVLRGALERERFLQYPSGILRDLVGFSGVSEGPAEELTERVAREAQESHAVLGETPETWSPLGDIGPLLHDEHGTLLLPPLRADDPAGLTAELTSVDDWGRLTVKHREEAGSTWQAALAVSPDAFVAVLPPGTMELALDLEEDTTPGPFHSFAGALLDEVVPEPSVCGRRPEVGVVWRVYQGTGTRVLDGDDSVDATDPTVRVRLPWTANAGYLVGRLVRGRARGALASAKDPSMAWRLNRHASARPDVVDRCPTLTVASPADRAIVVVHGTMGCAIPLAEIVHEIVDREGLSTTVLRYEHDTWQPIAANAAELASSVRGLGVRSVLFVAHSRGGLVARHAALDLARDGTAVHPAREDVATTLLTLGTPFAGTPLIGAAELARRGLGAGVAALRGLGGPVVDVVSRVVLRNLRHQLPEGVREMHEQSSYLQLLRGQHGPRLVSAAGETDPQGVDDSWGFGDGAARSFFEGPNDRVVSVSSATAVAGADTVLVRSDHASYGWDLEVRRHIADLASQL